jgi:hypothetical protein
MMRLMGVALCFAFACGGKSTPKAQEPAPAPAADDPDNHGIGQAEVAAQACYEDCLEKGPAGATDWAAKSDADKQTACNASCKNAGAGMPSDQPAK